MQQKLAATGLGYSLWHLENGNKLKYAQITISQTYLWHFVILMSSQLLFEVEDVDETEEVSMLSLDVGMLPL